MHRSKFPRRHDRDHSEDGFGKNSSAVRSIAGACACLHISERPWKVATMKGALLCMLRGQDQNLFHVVNVIGADRRIFRSDFES